MSHSDFDVPALVPKLPLGDPEGEALASQDGKLELPAPNSQAGAWELAKQIQEQSAKYGVDAKMSGYTALTQLTQLPKGWTYTRIGEVTNKCIQRKPADEEELLYVDIGSIDRDLKRIIAPQRLIGKDAPSRARKIINSGDVLVSLTRPNLNAVALVSEEFDNQIASTGFEVIKPINVDGRYIFGLVRSKTFIDAISDKVQGALYPAAKSNDVQEYAFPLPPLAEQQQIAAKLDELLAQVDTLKTRLDAIPKILKRFRQSVLAAAVSGKLTEEWREKKDEFEPVEMLNWKWSAIPSDWNVFYYSDLVQSRLGKMLDKAKNTGTPTCYLGNINVRWLNFDLTNIQEILVSDKEQIELTVKVGDVLICEGGEPGRCAIWNIKADKPIIFQKALHKASVGEKIIPEWLVYNLKNDCDNKSIEQLFTGTTIKHLTGKALSKYPLRIPPLKEQTEIVHQVEQLFAYADQIEQRVKDAQVRVNHLTQSILAKAFRGELTAEWREQNPELISGENSAEASLAKIKAEREKAKNKKSK